MIVREEFGRDGQIIDPIAARTVGTVELLELVLELAIGLRVVKSPRRENETAGELRPDLAEIGIAILAERLLVVGAKVVVGPVAAGKPDNGALAGQVPSPSQMVERRDELAMGQVACRAKQNDRAGLRHPGSWKRLTQRIGFRHAGRLRHR